jgi:hypothetical protein
MAARMKIDTRDFDKTLVRYANATKKELADILNTKAYYIAVGALKHTPKASKVPIKQFAKNWEKSAPTIIKTYKLRKPFDKEEAIKRFIKYRNRTISYLKVGWVMAIRVLGRFANLPRRVDSARLVGRPKGGVTVARKGKWNPSVVLFNGTGYEPKQSDALQRYGKPALSKAFFAEMVSMMAYTKRKLVEAGRKTGVRIK